MTELYLKVCTKVLNRLTARNEDKEKGNSHGELHVDFLGVKTQGAAGRGVNLT